MSPPAWEGQCAHAGCTGRACPIAFQIAAHDTDALRLVVDGIVPSTFKMAQMHVTGEKRGRRQRLQSASRRNFMALRCRAISKGKGQKGRLRTC